ncbi:MAG TPA: RidA family protein [Vicinamibacteria bacterium]|nr:RidA family protein [Vicinamibacteria bacterium]
MKTCLLLMMTVGVGAAGTASAQASARTPEKQHVNPPGLQTPTGYTHVVAASGGKTVYVAGQVALNATGNVVGKGDLGAQARQVFANLRTALSAAGATPADLVKITWYVVGYKPDMLPALREARTAFLGEAKSPASTLVGVAALAREDFLVEVEAIAVVP